MSIRQLIVRLMLYFALAFVSAALATTFWNRLYADIRDYRPHESAQRIKRWREDPSSDPELEEWYRIGLPYGIPFGERKPERLGSPIEAVALYLAILAQFSLVGSVCFKRPAIILGKQERYKEALAVCEMALQNPAFSKPTREGAELEFGKRKVSEWDSNRQGGLGPVHDRSYYETAQICLNGHPITSGIESSPEMMETYCVSQIRDLKSVVEREKAAIGVFIALGCLAGRSPRCAHASDG